MTGHWSLITGPVPLLLLCGFLGACQTPQPTSQALSSGSANPIVPRKNMRVLEAWEAGAAQLRINLAPGYQVEMLSAADSRMFLVVKSASAKSKVRSGLGIYRGASPVLRSRNEPVYAVRREVGEIAGIEVEWLGWETTLKGQTWYHAETILRGLPAPMPERPRRPRPRSRSPEKETVYHLFISASSAEDLEAYRGMAETLRVEWHEPPADDTPPARQIP